MNTAQYAMNLEQNLLAQGFTPVPGQQPFRLLKKDSSPVMAEARKGVNIPLTLCTVSDNVKITSRKELNDFIKEIGKTCMEMIEPGKGKFSRMFQGNKLLYHLVLVDGLDASVRQELGGGGYRASLPILQVPIFFDAMDSQLTYLLNLYPPFEKNSPAIMWILKDILVLFEKVIQPDLLLLPKLQAAFQALRFAHPSQRTKIIKDKYPSLQFVLWALQALLFEEIMHGNDQAKIDVLLASLRSGSEGSEAAGAFQQQSLMKWLSTNELSEALAHLIVPVAGGSAFQMGSAMQSHSMYIDQICEQRSIFFRQGLLSALVFCNPCRKIVTPSVITKKGLFGSGEVLVCPNSDKHKVNNGDLFVFLPDEKEEFFNHMKTLYRL